MRVLVFGAAAVFLLCASGCGPEAKPVANVPDIGPKTTTSAPQPPMSVPAYQAVLTRTEQAVRTAMDRVVAAGSLADVDSARLDLAAVLENARAELEPLLPPTEVRTLHSEVLADLAVSTALRQYDQTSWVAQPNSCGVPPAADVQLVKAKQQVYWRVRGSGVPAEKVARFATAGLRWGDLMLPPEPADPPRPAARRARNGEVVQRSGARGRGRLQITNSEDSDVVVAAVTGGDPKNPQASIYVRAGSTATLTGLAGDSAGHYSVYFKTGQDWDAGRRGFTEACSYHRSLHIFTNTSDWTIDLRKTSGGDALGNTVPAF